MKNYKITIAYDGSEYYGYQRQNKHITVQEVVEKNLSKLFKQCITINGSGRTDTGVHALGQVINFKSDIEIPIDNLKVALNHLLPGNVRVMNTELVAEDFHARYSAIGKHYKYKILQTNACNPFVQKYMWQIERKLNLEYMQAATSLVEGEHDFTTFRSTGSIEGVAVRKIYRATWSYKYFGVSDFENMQNAKCYELDIYGNGFLYHMVRNLVGTIVQVGLGRMSIEEFKQLFAGRARTSKCAIAPANGLYLNKVEY